MDEQTVIRMASIYSGKFQSQAGRLLDAKIAAAAGRKDWRKVIQWQHVQDAIWVKLGTAI